MEKPVQLPSPKSPLLAQQLEQAVISQLQQYNPTFSNNFPADINRNYIQQTADAFAPIIGDSPEKSAAFVCMLAPVLAKFQEFTLVQNIQPIADTWFMRLDKLKNLKNISDIPSNLSQITIRSNINAGIPTIIPGTETKRADVSTAFKGTPAPQLQNAFQKFYQATEHSYKPEQIAVNVKDKTIPVFLFPNCGVSPDQAFKLIHDIANIDSSLIDAVANTDSTVPIHFSKTPYKAAIAGGYSSTEKKITIHKDPHSDTEFLACTLAHEMEHAKQHKNVPGLDGILGTHDPFSCVVIDRMMEAAAYTKGAFVFHKLQKNEMLERTSKNLNGPGPYTLAYHRSKTNQTTGHLTPYGHIMASIEKADQKNTSSAETKEKDKLLLEKGFETFYKGDIPALYAENMVPRYKLLSRRGEKETLSATTANLFRHHIAPYADSISDITRPEYTQLLSTTFQNLSEQCKRVGAEIPSFFTHRPRSNSALHLTGIRAELAGIESRQQEETSRIEKTPEKTVKPQPATRRKTTTPPPRLLQPHIRD